MQINQMENYSIYIILYPNLNANDFSWTQRTIKCLIKTKTTVFAAKFNVIDVCVCVCNQWLVAQFLFSKFFLPFFLVSATELLYLVNVTKWWWRINGNWCCFVLYDQRYDMQLVNCWRILAHSLQSAEKVLLGMRCEKYSIYFMRIFISWALFLANFYLAWSRVVYSKHTHTQEKGPHKGSDKRYS